MARGFDSNFNLGSGADKYDRYSGLNDPNPLPDLPSQYEYARCLREEKDRRHYEGGGHRIIFQQQGF